MASDNFALILIAVFLKIYCIIFSKLKFLRTVSGVSLLKSGLKILHLPYRVISVSHKSLEDDHNVLFSTYFLRLKWKKTTLITTLLHGLNYFHAKFSKLCMQCLLIIGKFFSSITSKVRWYWYEIWEINPLSSY